MEPQHRIYGLVILFYVIGDIGTTFIGLTYFPIIREQNQIALFAIQNFGFWVVIPMKMIVVGVSYWGFSLFEERVSIAIPGVLILQGILLTGWNSYLLLKIAV